MSVTVGMGLSLDLLRIVNTGAGVRVFWEFGGVGMDVLSGFLKIIGIGAVAMLGLGTVVSCTLGVWERRLIALVETLGMMGTLLAVFVWALLDF